MKATKPLYLSDVLDQKARARAIEQARWAKQDAKRAALEAKFKVPENMHPGIGILTTAKGVKFYAHIGPKRVYTEGTVDHLTALLTA